MVHNPCILLTVYSQLRTCLSSVKSWHGCYYPVQNSLIAVVREGCLLFGSVTHKLFLSIRSHFSWAVLLSSIIFLFLYCCTYVANKDFQYPTNFQNLINVDVSVQSVMQIVHTISLQRNIHVIWWVHGHFFNPEIGVLEHHRSPIMVTNGEVQIPSFRTGDVMPTSTDSVSSWLFRCSLFSGLFPYGRPALQK